MTKERAIQEIRDIIQIYQTGTYALLRCEKTALEMAIEALSVEPQKIENRWIPVTERLPEEHTRVLVCDRTSVYMANLHDGWWYFSPAEIGIIVAQSHITAWMPLPEPYSEIIDRKVNEVTHE